MKTSIIILAHGNQERWLISGAPRMAESKHMLPVRGEPLLKRTIDLFKPHGDIHLFAWAWYKKWINHPCLNIHPVSHLLNGIMQTQSHWSDRTIFLLGDVLFSRKAVSEIVNLHSLKFVGRVAPNTVSGKVASELFGFVMLQEDWKNVVEKCEFAVSQSDTRYSPKLWSLYRAICGNHPDQHIIDLSYLWIINDYTDDVDSQEAFKQFWPKMVIAELKDV